LVDHTGQRLTVAQPAAVGNRLGQVPPHGVGGVPRDVRCQHHVVQAEQRVVGRHRLDLENGAAADDLANWVADEHPSLDWKAYGFQEFAEFLNYAQDKLLVRVEPDEERGLVVHLGAEFYPPAPKVGAELPPVEVEEEEEEGPQPIVEGQPTIFEPNPPPPKPVKATRKRAAKKAAGTATARRPRRKKTE